MRINLPPKLIAERFQKEHRNMLSILFADLNRILEEYGLALNRKLTVSDNMQAETRDVSFISDDVNANGLKIPYSLGVIPSYVLVNNLRYAETGMPVPAYSYSYTVRDGFIVAHFTTLPSNVKIKGKVIIQI